MHLHNTVVTITITLPAVGVDRDAGVETNRQRIYDKAIEDAYYDWQDNQVSQKPVVKIVDCPDYPALVTDTVL